jgi:UDPglucose--hexose-1-phosphate uridylyltransferase
MLTLLFRNHGELAGTSLRHAHAQVIVTSIVPPLLRWKEAEAQRYFDSWGRCVYCDILAFERQERHRVVLENAAYLAFVPFAAEVPCEIWLLPKRHQADFGAITAAEKTALALALHDVLARLHAKLGDPDYNYIINTSMRYRAEEPHLHWYLQILPRLTTPAGFEIGSGMSLNPSLPEADAAFLNEASAGFLAGHMAPPDVSGEMGGGFSVKEESTLPRIKRSSAWMAAASSVRGI